MATTTPNYNLKKPSLNDFFNVQDLNDNTDIIDEELGKANEEIGNLILNTYTKQQVDKFLNDINESSYWKASVDTFDDIASTYPTPKQGWTVSVKDTNRTYRYNGSAWIDVFSLISKAELGLDKVDNTSDLEKPISTATQKALNTLTSNVNSLSNTKANAADVYSKTEIDSKFGNASTSVSGLEEKVNTNTSNIAANTANIGKVSGKVGDLTTLSTTEKTDLVKSINEVNAKANSNAADIAGLGSSKANAADVYTKTETDNKLSGKSDASHTHDGRYYTETEIDNKLSTKSDSTHNHDSVYYTKSNVYTKTETDNKLSTKSDSSHTHDGRYYTKAEVDGKVQGVLSHKDENISSEQGLHGIRYYDGKLEIKDNGEWKTTDTNILPKQVTSITAYKTSSNVIIYWTAPDDSACAKYNVYYYVGSTAPTSLSQFTKLTTTSSLNYSHTTSDANDAYIVVTSVTDNNIENDDLSYVVQTQAPPSFANASWDTINAIAQSGQASSIFSIGDTKSISINGTNYNIQIYDFNHDELSDGSGKAKITFGLANCLSTKYNMNSSNTNSGGWGSCALRTTLQNTILNQLPTELKSLIKTVKKKTSAGSQSTTINTTNDTLFLFSEVELFGSTTYSVAGEGTQYPIFTNNNSRIKKQGDTGSAGRWWERSPYASNSTAFCCVNTDGSAGNPGASIAYGVCFGFCI